MAIARRDLKRIKVIKADGSKTEIQNIIQTYVNRLLTELCTTKKKKFEKTKRRVGFHNKQIAIELLTRVFAPHQINPLDINPLREILTELIDVEALRRADAIPLFIAATNVATGRVRIFENAELTVDTLLASACLPQVNQALSIDGQFYWDGGFAANPPLFPLIANGSAADILIVQVEAPHRESLPVSAADIRNRLSQIVFNATLLREIDALAYMRRMCESLLPTGNRLARRIRKLHLHSVDGGRAMTELSASSKLTPDRHFVERLRDLGRAQAEDWLARNFDALGRRSTIDLGEAGAAAQAGADA